MRELRRENKGVFRVSGGAHIIDTIAEAIELSAKRGSTTKFLFSGVTVSVRSDSNLDLILRDWSRALNGCIGKKVGPYPKAELSDEDKANDARVEAENERERQERTAEY